MDPNLPIPEALKRPLLLRPDNFTPLSRTPWASTALAHTIKKGVVADADLAIGEAWEFSCDPQFPSRLVKAATDGSFAIENLPELVARFPEAVLSPSLAARSGAVCEVLVKLLAPKEPLSVQVHPADSDPALSPDECGKPESWLVVAAEPGAGIYLGFKRAVSRDELRRGFSDPAQAEQAKDLMHFVPVKPGEYFEIGPGVPHAVGGGLVLLEPQRIRFGQSGKTLRLWDWGRRYNPAGLLDPVHGQPRPLHMEEGLRLVDPQTQVGEAFVDSLRRLPQVREEVPGLQVSRFPDNGSYQTLWLEAKAGLKAKMHVDDGYGALIVISGSFLAQDQVLQAGQPALLPHAAMPLRLETTLSLAGQAALVIPSGASCHFFSQS